VIAGEEVAPPGVAAGPAALTCREFVDLLYDYLLGGLGAERTAAMNAHLAVCPSCVAYLKSYEASIRMGRLALGPSEGPVPAEVPEALVRAVLAARPPRTPVKRL
jgi:anti-sigma factor RsiW